MKKLVARLSQLSANRTIEEDIESNSDQLSRKQLPFLSIMGAQKVNLEKETSDFLKRGSLDSTGLLRVFENKDNVDNLSEKDKALYQIFNKNEINLRNAAEGNLTIYILRKQVKNNLEMRFLQRVLENIAIFKQNPGMASDSVTNSLFKQLKHEFYPRRTILFNYGDQGTKYYIVLKGSTYCLLPDSQLTDEQRNHIKNQNNCPITPSQRQQSQSLEPQDKDDNPKLLKILSNFAAKKKTLALFSKLGMDQNFLQEIREEQSLNDEEFMKKKFPNFTSVRTLGPGESFGEIALMTNKGRSATIVLKDDTHFMSLSKEGFNKVFSIYRAKIFDEQIQFLHNFSFLRDLSKFALLQLLYNLRIESYSCKQVIYAEKDGSDYIYLIKRGEVEISKTYTVKEPFNEPNYYPNQIIKRKKNLKLIQEDNNIVVEKTTEGAYQKKLHLKRENKVSKRINISKQGANSYFGEQEIINDKLFRESQATCSSVSCEIYIIEKEKLKSVLSAKDYQSLVEESQARICYQQKRLEQIIDLKENQSQKIDQITKTARAQNESELQFNGESVKQKRNTFHVQQNVNTSSEMARFVKGGVIMKRDNHMSKVDDSSSVTALTPQTLFPVKKKKSFLTSTRDSINSSSTGTRILSQSKPRFSAQTLLENPSSLTHIGQGDTLAYRSPISSFPSSLAYIPSSNSQLRRTFTNEYINSKATISRMNSPKTMNILPLNILTLNKSKSNETERAQDDNTADYNENTVSQQIQQLKKVHRESVLRGAQLKEMSKTIMKSQLLDRPKDTLANKIIRSKRNTLFKENLLHQQSIILYSPKQIFQKGAQSQTYISNSDFTPLSTVNNTRTNTGLKNRRNIIFHKNPSILLQSNDTSIPPNLHLK